MWADKKIQFKKQCITCLEKKKTITVNITNPWKHILKLLYLYYIFYKSFLLSLLLTTNSCFQILLCFFKWLASFELDFSVFYPCNLVSILFPDDIHNFKNFHMKGLLSDTIPQSFSKQDCTSKCDSWEMSSPCRLVASNQVVNLWVQEQAFSRRYTATLCWNKTWLWEHNT